MAAASPMARVHPPVSTSSFLSNYFTRLLREQSTEEPSANGSTEIPGAVHIEGTRAERGELIRHFFEGPSPAAPAVLVVPDVPPVAPAPVALSDGPAVPAAAPPVRPSGRSAGRRWTQLTAKDRALLGHKRVGNYARSEVALPQSEGKTMTVWLPIYGISGRDFKRDLSKVEGLFKRTGRHPEEWYQFLDCS